MQTFLPYPNFAVSAMVLDYRRLGKQRVEARQLQTALQGSGTAWSHHPAAKMWEGHVLALMLYGDCMIREWVRRGYENNMPLMLNQGVDDQIVSSQVVMPAWLGREDYHAAHRSNLLRKDPEHYGQFGWSEPSTLPYIWPSQETVA